MHTYICIYLCAYTHTHIHTQHSEYEWVGGQAMFSFNSGPVNIYIRGLASERFMIGCGQSLNHKEVLGQSSSTIQ